LTEVRAWPMQTLGTISPLCTLLPYSRVMVSLEVLRLAREVIGTRPSRTLATNGRTHWHLRVSGDCIARMVFAKICKL
jgi:hypothetical protein